MGCFGSKEQEPVRAPKPGGAQPTPQATQYHGQQQSNLREQIRLLEDRKRLLEQDVEKHKSRARSYMGANKQEDADMELRLLQRKEDELAVVRGDIEKNMEASMVKGHQNVAYQQHQTLDNAATNFMHVDADEAARVNRRLDASHAQTRHVSSVQAAPTAYAQGMNMDELRRKHLGVGAMSG